MWKKSLSEKIARVFEVVGYIQLIPTIPLMIFSAVFIFPLLISVPVFGVGLTLFVGYVKHSRTTLGEGKILPLWIATFLFNFLPLLYLTIKYCQTANQTFERLGLFTILLIFWWIIACCLSLAAIYDEFIENKN